MRLADWLPLALFGLFMGVLMVFLARHQATRYQRYLSEHSEQTSKIVAGQRELIAQQERTIAVAERNVAALERIASALEHKGS